MQEEEEDPVHINNLKFTLKDLAFARKLQEEENRKREQSTRVTCLLTGKQIPVEKLYILDECSCKYIDILHLQSPLTFRFEKEALVSYVMETIKTQVNVKCPSKSCNASISVRDMKELMPLVKCAFPRRSLTKQATRNGAKSFFKAGDSKNCIGIEAHFTD
jgi:hypothetical protein